MKTNYPSRNKAKPPELRRCAVKLVQLRKVLDDIPEALNEHGQESSSKDTHLNGDPQNPKVSTSNGTSRSTARPKAGADLSEKEQQKREKSCLPKAVHCFSATIGHRCAPGATQAEVTCWQLKNPTGADFGKSLPPNRESSVDCVQHRTYSLNPLRSNRSPESASRSPPGLLGMLGKEQRSSDRPTSTGPLSLRPTVMESTPSEVRSSSEFRFPFEATPSGNLKIRSNQVVFESKKVSVLVADPRTAKVNVTAESSQEGLLKSPLDAPSVTSSVTSGLLSMGQTASGESHPLLTSMMQPPPSASSLQLPFHQEQYSQNDGADQRDEGNELEKEVSLTKLGFSSSDPIDWSRISLPKKSDLARLLEYRIGNFINPDVTVMIGDTSFKCHLMVLQSYSTFFEQIGNTHTPEVQLPVEHVSPEAFSVIYDWMIFPGSESHKLILRNTVLEVFTAAQFLGVKDLEYQCWTSLQNQDIFAEDKAFLLFMGAKKKNHQVLMEMMIPRINKFFLPLVSSKNFLDLELDELCAILSSDFICVHGEIEVFMSGVRWLLADWEQRQQQTAEVMQCVRFGLILPWQLVDIRRNPENPEFIAVTSFPAVQKMVEDGLAFAIVKYWYGGQLPDYKHWIDVLGLTEPTARNWLGDSINYVKYVDFLRDLDLYRRKQFVEKKRSKSSSTWSYLEAPSAQLEESVSAAGEPQQGLVPEVTVVASPTTPRQHGDDALPPTMEEFLAHRELSTQPGEGE